MSLLADRIERFILEKILEQQEEVTILKRNELADELECAPSQISYVLSTRFSNDRGFIVESRRGLGGFIQIQRLETPPVVHVRVRREEPSLMKQPQSNLPAQVPITMAEVDRVLYYLLTESRITQREAQLMHEAFRIVLDYVTPKKREDALLGLYRSLMEVLKEE